MPTPLRITFLITDLYIGGSPLMLRDSAYGLAALNNGQDFQVTVISLKPLPPVGECAFPSTPLEIAGRRIKIKLLSLDLDSLRHLPRAVGRLRAILDMQQPDFLYSILIHANLLSWLTVPWLKRRPIVIQSIHTLQPKPRWHWMAQRSIAGSADALVAPSRAILQKIGSRTHFPVQKTIENGIDFDRFATAKPLENSDFPWKNVQTKTIGFVGRFDPVKRLDRLIYALKSLHNIEGKRPKDQNLWHLVLVGYGPAEGALRDLSTSLHLTPFVHFPGPTKTPERWYKSFDCLCLSSSVEGFGLVLAEAMAAGIPVVAPKTEVTSAVVSDGLHGRLVSDPSPERLAQAIQEVTANPPTANVLQEHIRANFSTARMVDLHKKFLNNFAKTRKPSHPHP